MSSVMTALHLSYREKFPRRIPLPVPIPLIQRLLRKGMTAAVDRYPKIFDRLGSQQSKIFLIDPVNMPFALLLMPDSKNPTLRACRRPCRVPYDARIAGTFLTLLDMIEGKLDGDALFFSRDLIVEGDTEAVVVLRNALDDLDGDLIGSIAESFGFPARIGLSILRRIERKAT